MTTEADAAPTDDLPVKDNAPGGTDAGSGRWRFPSAFTLLFGVTVAVWLLAFIVPSGVYKTDEASGRPIPGSYAKAVTRRRAPCRLPLVIGNETRCPPSA